MRGRDGAKDAVRKKTKTTEKTTKTTEKSKMFDRWRRSKAAGWSRLPPPHLRARRSASTSETIGKRYVSKEKYSVGDPDPLVRGKNPDPNPDPSLFS
jgi:hypothetical protein